MAPPLPNPVDVLTKAAPEFDSFYGYNGEETSPVTGMQYLRARYYDTEDGRFNVADTYLGDISKPLTLNRYTYTVNNPVMNTDPTGHWPQWLDNAVDKVKSGVKVAADWVNDKIVKPVVKKVKEAAGWVKEKVVQPVANVVKQATGGAKKIYEETTSMAAKVAQKVTAELSPQKIKEKVEAMKEVIHQYFCGSAEKMDSDGGGGSSAGGRKGKNEKIIGNPRKQMPEEAKGILKWRNFMKKTICVIGVFILMMGLSGCFFPGSRTDELNRDYVSDTEAIKKVEDTVIQALEEKDEELLKSIFSEKALTRAGDMDKGIEYIFDLYKGDFVEISEENHSTDEHIERDKSTKDIAAQCKITTTEGEYILSWRHWTVQEEDPSAIGVYSLRLMKAESHYRFRPIAGVEYLNRYVVHDTIDGFVDTFYRKEGTFTSLLSTELLAKVGTEKQLNQMDEMLSNFFYSDIGVGWVTYEDVDGKEKMHTYYEIFINDKLHIIHFTFDDVEQDKISVFQIAEYDGGDFEEETECGIYLP